MQRKENRTPTKIELDAYNKILELTDYSMGVCKPKTYTDKKEMFIAIIITFRQDMEKLENISWR